jgi:beta-lactam-binding protein with PASTA domain
MARPVPADLEDALAANPAARETFWALPPEQKDTWVAYLDRSRLPRARRRRVADAVRRLGADTQTRETAVATAGAPVPVSRDDWWLWFLGLAVLAAVAALIVWLTVYRHHHHDAKPATAPIPATKTAVPKVVGLRYQAAQFQLRQQKLGSTLLRELSPKAKGIVVHQSPSAGKTVPKGTPVTLVVSSGAPKVALPNVVGMQAVAAVNTLTAQKLKPKTAQVPSSKPSGTVVAQSPAAGQQVAQGGAVRLNVAKRQTSTSTTTTVRTTTTAPTTTLSPPASGPDYTGMRLPQAIQKIVQGRQEAIVTYVASGRPAGVVVANAKAGSRERLQVSAGPQPQPLTSVPDVTGEDAATAQQDLQTAGFTVVQAKWPVSDSTQDGQVVFETPAGGKQAPQGVAIVSYVGTVNG